ncbi:MAG: lamin tail domain-containing protein, partial [Candidatus Spechtbacteria bacterium]|nr:lamin tail domain-containing protein [Candidatus Spechtbacteria bacterium]
TQITVEPSSQTWLPVSPYGLGLYNAIPDISLSADFETQQDKDTALANFQNQLEGAVFVPEITILEPESEPIAQNSKEEEKQDEENKTEETELLNDTKDEEIEAGEIKGESIDITDGLGGEPSGQEQQSSFGPSSAYGPAGPGFINKNSEASDVLDHLVITEIQIKSVYNAYDEYVIIYNPTAEDVSLAEWSIQRTTGGGGTMYKENFESGHLLLAGSYFKIANSKSSHTIKYEADMLYNTALNSFTLTDDNTVFLVNSQDEIATGEEDTIVDKVGYGDSFSPEFVSAPNPEAGERLIRRTNSSGVFVDTDSNAKDFKITESAYFVVPSTYTPDSFYITINNQGGDPLLPGSVIELPAEYSDMGEYMKGGYHLVLDGPSWGEPDEHFVGYFIAYGSQLGLDTQRAIIHFTNEKWNILYGCYTGSCDIYQTIFAEYGMRSEDRDIWEGKGDLESGDTLFIGFIDWAPPSLSPHNKDWMDWINSNGPQPDRNYFVAEYYFEVEEEVKESE